MLRMKALQAAILRYKSEQLSSQFETVKLFFD